MRSNVRGNGSGATLRGLGSWKYDAFEEVGQTLHFLRIGAARVQECAARAIYRSRGFGGELHDVARRARRVVEIDVGQTFPATADTDDLPFVFGAAIHHAFAYHIQTGDVATAGKNSDAFVGHDCATNERPISLVLCIASASSADGHGQYIACLPAGAEHQWCASSAWKF